MASLIETIKAKLDVVEEVGLVVALQKSGKAFKGLCPFHNERTPSFYVFGESQTWHCFGCNEGGDIFTFVQKQQGLEFRDALLYLAEKAGVAVEEYGHRDPEEEQANHAAKERLRKLNEDALLWFHQMLLRSKDAAGARGYVQSRGISTDSVIAFSLGYAPDSRDDLCHYLLRLGYTEHELVEGGLARERDGDLGTVSGEREGVGNGDSPANGGQVASGDSAGKSGGVYDYFRSRIIFPIRDIRGRVIGFGGRALGGGQPKYLNSPQTRLFEKNSILYALDMAKDAIKLTKQVIIVEGYVDAVIAHQYGTKQTVACMGSAITEKHIRQLKKMTKQVTLALDPDAAGATATEHGIQEALKAFDRTIVPVPLPKESYRRGNVSGTARKRFEGMIRLEEQVDAEINVLQLPPGEDPDEVIRRDFSVWSYAVSHPLPLVDYYFVVRTAGLDLRDATGKTEAARRLLPIIGTISDRVKRDAYLRKLAGMIAIDERSLNDELQLVLKGNRPAGVTAAFSTPMEQPGLDSGGRNRVQLEDYLIGLLLQNPGLSTHVCGIINDGDFAGTDTRELYHILNSVYQRDSSPLFQSFEEFVPSALLVAVDRARKCVESRSPLEGAALVKAAIQCATRLKRARLLQLNTDVRFLMEEAKETGDVAAKHHFQRQLLAIHQQLRTIDSAMHLQG